MYILDLFNRNYIQMVEITDENLTENIIIK